MHPLRGKTMNLPLEKVEKLEKRELAKQMDLSEERLDEKLRDLGFTSLADFTDNQSRTEKKKINYSLSEMEKRKLQGLLGEKVTRFIEGKIRRFIRSGFNNEWIIKSYLDLRTLDECRQLHFGERQSFQGNSLSISGGNVTHYGVEEEVIREKIRQKHYACSAYLFEKFTEYQVPSIDHVLYALRKTGETESFEYRVKDHSEESGSFTGEKLEVDLEKIRDFKVIGLEVKTSESSDAENLFSSLQREVRDTAKESAFLDLYKAHVNYSISTQKIPEEVPVEIEKV
ncbi:MAG: hypothetical protein ABEJ56_00800 [Candidatus Nanohaloarchaea archaeon]